MQSVSITNLKCLTMPLKQRNVLLGFKSHTWDSDLFLSSEESSSGLNLYTDFFFFFLQSNLRTILRIKKKRK